MRNGPFMNSRIIDMPQRPYSRNHAAHVPYLARRSKFTFENVENVIIFTGFFTYNYTFIRWNQPLCIMSIPCTTLRARLRILFTWLLEIPLTIWTSDRDSTHVRPQGPWSFHLGRPVEDGNRPNPRRPALPRPSKKLRQGNQWMHVWL